MEVVVTARHCEVTDRFREHAAEKLAKLEKHDHRIIRVHVEIDCERNPRQHDQAVHIELTAFSKGPVIRAEAAADHQMAALDLALDKMASQMRRAADRRRVHHGRHAPVSVGQALADMPVVEDATPTTRSSSGRSARSRSPATDRSSSARRRTRRPPMTLDQALYEMELVGHDFYLFVDKESERPAVVYRRRGYDYGVISLDLGGRLSGPVGAQRAMMRAWWK